MSAQPSGPVRVGIVGAGSISEQYLRTLARAADVEVAFVADLDLERAARQASAHGVPASGSFEELLADAAIEVVVNLTIPAAHAEVGLRALESGRHVWSEKPIALAGRDAQTLLDAASARGLQLGCAPDTALGHGQQLTQRLLADGAIGRPLSALAVVQNAGPDLWHPSPEFLFADGAGPLLDLGPYFLGAIVQHLGPVARVTAHASTARPTRVVGTGPRAGTVFGVEVPTQHTALLELEGGGSAVLLTSFESEIERSLFEITGSHGSIVPPDPTEFGDRVVLHAFGAAAPETVTATSGELGRGVGVVELARAIRSGERCRLDGTLAAHVLEIMETIATSAATRETVAVTSTVAPLRPLPPDWDPYAATL